MAGESELEWSAGTLWSIYMHVNNGSLSGFRTGRTLFLLHPSLRCDFPVLLITASLLFMHYCGGPKYYLQSFKIKSNNFLLSVFFPPVSFFIFWTYINRNKVGRVFWKSANFIDSITQIRNGFENDFSSTVMRLETPQQSMRSLMLLWAPTVQ